MILAISSLSLSLSLSLSFALQGTIMCVLRFPHCHHPHFHCPFQSSCLFFSPFFILFYPSSPSLSLLPFSHPPLLLSHSPSLSYPLPSFSYPLLPISHPAGIYERALVEIHQDERSEQLLIAFARYHSFTIIIQ